MESTVLQAQALVNREASRPSIAAAFEQKQFSEGSNSGCHDGKKKQKQQPKQRKQKCANAGSTALAICILLLPLLPPLLLLPFAFTAARARLFRGVLPFMTQTATMCETVQLAVKLYGQVLIPVFMH